MEETELAAEYTALLQFLYLCPVGIIELGPTGAISRMNPLAAQLILPLAGAGVSNLVEALDHYGTGLGQLLAAFPDACGTICQNLPIELRRGNTPGRGPWVLALTVLKISPVLLMAVLSDISELMAKQQAIRANERRFRAIFDGVRDCAIFSLDADGSIDSWNRSGERLFGHLTSEVIGRATDFLYAPREPHAETIAERLAVARRSAWDGHEGWYQRQDGTRFWGEENLSILADDQGDVVGFSVVVRDITERHQTEESLRSQADTDHLTGLLNRRRFTARLAAEVDRFHQSSTPLSVIVIDADHFKRVNDTHGHQAGDLVLQEIAQLCRRSSRAADVAARLGGEEFAVLLPATAAPGAQIVAERLRRAAAETVVQHGESQIRFTLSLGVATMHPAILDGAALLHAADGALYVAKRSGRNRVVVSPRPD